MLLCLDLYSFESLLSSAIYHISGRIEKIFLNIFRNKDGPTGPWPSYKIRNKRFLGDESKFLSATEMIALLLCAWITNDVIRR